MELCPASYIWTGRLPTWSWTSNVFKQWGLVLEECGFMMFVGITDIISKFREFLRIRNAKWKLVRKQWGNTADLWLCGFCMRMWYRCMWHICQKCTVAFICCCFNLVVCFKDGIIISKHSSILFIELVVFDVKELHAC